MSTVIRTKGELVANQLIDRKNGRWWPTIRKGPIFYLEMAGSSMALIMRCSLRKNVGLESYSFKQAILGFVWLRLFTMLSAFTPDSTTMVSAFFNPITYTTAFSLAFNIYSLTFLCSCVWNLAKTEIGTFRKDPGMNVKGRGRTRFFDFLIDQQRHGGGGYKPILKILQTEGFVQTIVEPVVIILIGTTLYLIPGCSVISLFLILGSSCYAFDEYNYARARIRLERIQRAQKLSGSETVEKQKEYGSGIQDIYV